MKNNFITKIIGATLAIAMMIGGAVGINAVKEAKPVGAAASWAPHTGAITAGNEYLIVRVDGNKSMNPKNSTASGNSTTSAGNYSQSNFSAQSGPDRGFIFEDAGNSKFYIKDGTCFVRANGTTNNGLASAANNNSDSDYGIWTVTETSTAGEYTIINNNSRQISAYQDSNWRSYGTNSGSKTNVKLYEKAAFGTLDHIKINHPANKLVFDVGETFSSSGLTLTGYDGANEATANSAAYSSGYTTDYDSHVFEVGEIGEQTVTVTYSGKTTTYTITVVAAPDFVHTYSDNSVFGSTTKDTQHTVTYTPASGPEYITLGGYKYSDGQSMSLANLAGMYFGNNEEYELESVKKNISKIVITTSSDVHDKVVMTEGPIALSEDATVTAELSNENKTLTYVFSGNNPFFKFKSTEAWYINMTSIKVFLGTDATIVSVTEVLAGIKEGTYMTGSTLSASDFDLIVTWSNGNVTEPTSGFTWTVRGIANGTLNEGDNAVVVTYQGVSSDPFNVVGTSIHATSISIEESNPIKLLVGKTVTLHATVTPSNSVDSVVWSSDNESVASVNDSGVITAHAIGIATITVTAGSVSTTRQVVVSAPAKATYSLVKIGSTSGYSSSSDVTFADGKIWNIPGNQTLNDGLKLGGNTKAAYNRAMYSKSAYESVRSVVIAYGTKDSQITVNFVKLYVYSSAADAVNGSEENADEIVDGTYTQNGKATFAPSSGNAWENKYFRIVHNLSSTVTSNKGIVLKQLALDTPNPAHSLDNSSSIKTISGVESNGGATVEQVALRFGGIIPVSDWNAINANWPITDFGVMFARGSMLTARSLDSLEEVFRNDSADVAMVHRGAVGTPNANGDDYIFTARLNLEEVDYDEVFYAAPFIIAGGEYYFLQEMHYSVRTLAEECLTSGESTLSQAALTTLKGNN